MNNPMLRRGLVIAAAVLALDQLTKWWVLTDLMNPPIPMTVTPFFNLVLAMNRGVSFSLFHDTGGPWLLSALAVVIVVALTYWLRNIDRLLPAIGLGMVIGGALGNVIDRLRFGAVVDFLDFHAAGWHWPAFNVADSGITVGVCLLLVDGLFRRAPEAKVPARRGG